MQVTGRPSVPDSATLAREIAALKGAIAQTSPDTELQIWQGSQLDSTPVPGSDVLVCPLTLHLPENLEFPARTVYERCLDVEGLRSWVQQQWQYPTGTGNLWLPIVLTAKGPLYAEVIGRRAETVTTQPSDALLKSPAATNSVEYTQPVHLTDAWRQLLYPLARGLIQWLGAPPATYLMQFSFQHEKICFDRLWPFPAAPALASLGVQVPDLYLCHWYCVTGRPILDLAIAPSIAHPVSI